MRSINALFAGLLLAGSVTPAIAADPIQETCPPASKVGADVVCYPLQFIVNTEMHPAGIPIIAYLFVRSDYPHGTPVPALVMAHGSGSMYSNANHNKGLNTKQKQWVLQYTQGFGIPTLHVDSFQSRYLLPDTAGDQRMFDWENPPLPGTMGGDDYRATSSNGTSEGPQDEDDTYVNVPFDPGADGWKDQSNGGGGVSEITERPYDMEAAYEFLAGNLAGTLRNNATGETLAAGFTPGTTDTIGNLVPGLTINPAVVGVYGTSHGGQTALATADRTRATSLANPMGLGGPDNDGKRFAAFFDYYGGCSMYGAFGGVSDSTWEPYAPFVFLHGQADPIWTDGAPEEGTVREKYEAAECGVRISRAKAMPGFNIFMESVLYKDAEHSFDGIVVGDIGSDETADDDYPGWLAKVHSNYQIVIPMLMAQAEIAADPSSTLADFGFHSGNPWFTTFPFDPSLPPQATFLTQTDEGNATVAIAGSMNSGSLDISDYVNDPFDYHEVTYSLAGAPAEVSIDAGGMLSIAYSGSGATGLNTSFLVVAESAQGQTLIAVTLTSTDGVNGELTFGETVSMTPADFVLGDPSSVSTPLNVLIGGADLLADAVYSVSGLPAGLSLAADGITLEGSVNPADLPADFAITADTGDLVVEATIQLNLNADGELVATAGGMSGAELNGTPVDLELAPINPPVGSNVISMSIASISVNESAGTVSIDVNRSGGGTGAISVDFETIAGTAEPGDIALPVDFIAKSGTLDWADSESGSKTIIIDIHDDADIESSEDFSVTLSNAVNATLIAPQATIVTITDDDPSTSDQFEFTSAEKSADESAASVMLSISRTGSGSGVASLSFATTDGSASSGSDYTGHMGTLSWADGETADKNIVISISDDEIDESDETFSVTLTAVSGAVLGSNAVTTVTILDDDSDDQDDDGNDDGNGDNVGSNDSGGGGPLAYLLVPLLLFSARRYRYI